MSLDQTGGAELPAVPEESSAIRPTESPVVHVLYDRASGAVLGRYSRYSVGDGGYAELDEESVLAVARDAGLLPDGAVSADADVGVLAVADPTEAMATDVWVDPGSGRLAPRPQLAVTADRRQLEGDGEDSVVVTVSARDAHGRLLDDRTDRVRVSTTRGKLAERGGLVQLRGGIAEITLRSVAETVALVTVAAEDLDGRYARGTLDLEFL
ncbi:hypothetical protein [Geodermatophilus sp. CPCC 205506]|uniref:hypothetical protein n=1 Tax=Geodermatophilus sp. CPCC 205506 TaxID=2936596 RepID=UPI003EEBA17E